MDYDTLPGIYKNIADRMCDILVCCMNPNGTFDKLISLLEKMVPGDLKTKTTVKWNKSIYIILITQ